MVVFTFSIFNKKQSFLVTLVETPFLGKFDPKNQNFLFKLKFGTRTNSDIQNSLVMFTFSVFDWKYFLGQICSKKLKL